MSETLLPWLLMLFIVVLFLRPDSHKRPRLFRTVQILKILLLSGSLVGGTLLFAKDRDISLANYLVFLGLAGHVLLVEIFRLYFFFYPDKKQPFEKPVRYLANAVLAASLFASLAVTYMTF